ncbi:TPA: hypothetical protein VJH57_001574 [Streptococcus pyogenes]|nr:hypothetical protein [Streptococcus pyogenes]HER1127317.1 hypothetical protein [Streptococcus pyogenes]HER1253853.1 hypothetical protein [Streptococcus pyogenes]HER1277272.1 hypothetical protein [Streptococcus pyogenes]HER1518280.1 hypothetical protein [Streptococcus pyogenes]
MKKIVYLFTLSVLIVCLGACTGGSKKDTTSKTPSSDTSKVSGDMSEKEYFDTLISKIDKVTTDNYKSDEYLFYDYKTILRDPKKYFSLKVRINNLKIIQISDKDKYTKMLANTPNGDLYMLFIETKRLETKLLETDNITINVRYLLSYEYTTTSGSENSVPLIYIDGYLLLDK